MSTLPNMIGSTTEPPSMVASMVFGDVMEIAKLMVLLIMLTLTTYGLYKNSCSPCAIQSQATSSLNSSRPPPMEAMG